MLLQQLLTIPPASLQQIVNVTKSGREGQVLAGTLACGSPLSRNLALSSGPTPIFFFACGGLGGGCFPLPPAAGSGLGSVRCVSSAVALLVI